MGTMVWELVFDADLAVADANLAVTDAGVAAGVCDDDR